MAILKFPFKAVAWTPDVSWHELPGDEYGSVVASDFVLDLSTLVVPKNPCVVDYNHNDAEPIGYARVSVSGGTLLAEGELVSNVEGDVADRIAKTGKDVPFGISPTLDLWSAERVDVGEGEVYNCNDREYVGPLLVYKGAVLLGISVCPYPTDEGTSFTPLARKAIKLNKQGVISMAKKRVKLEADIVADEEKREEDVAQFEGDEAGIADAVSVKNAELQEFIDAFGLERGVQYYQEGLTVEEATQRAYGDVVAENAELKAKLAKFEEDDEIKDLELDEDEEKETELESDAQEAPTNDPEEIKFRRSERRSIAKSLAVFAAKIASLEKLVASQRAVSRRGDSVGLSASVREPARAQSYREAFAKAIR